MQILPKFLKGTKSAALEYHLPVYVTGFAKTILHGTFSISRNNCIEILKQLCFPVLHCSHTRLAVCVGLSYG